MNRLFSKSTLLFVSVVSMFDVCRALADSAVTYRTVALSGQVAPGAETGQNFASFGYPFIDESGHVAFSGYLAGPGVTISNDLGYWAEGKSGAALEAREGYSAPNTEMGTIFQLSPVYSFGHNGAMSFGSVLQGPSVTSANNKGIWSNQPGNQTLVARKGDQPPGFVPGSTFLLLDNPTAPRGGTTAFSAVVYNPDFSDSHQSHSQYTLWSFHEGVLSAFAREGDAAPGSDPGTYFDILSTPSVTRTGDFLFAATLYGPGVPSYGIQGAWFKSSNGMSLVARTDSSAPGPSSGFVYGGFLTDSFSVNSSGQTAFIAQAYQPQAPYGDVIGIYAGGADSMHYVIKEGSPAPGLPSGVTIDNVQSLNQYIPIDDSGTLAFHARLSGTGINSSNSNCIFKGTYDNLGLLVQEGDQAPGTSSGVVFDEFPTQIQLNNEGEIAFVGILRGPGVDFNNNNGIWAQDLDGTLHLVIRNGDPFEVAAGDLRIVSYFTYFGNPAGGGTSGRAFNDRGEITFAASFTDGSHGVFVARVPEPSTYLLLTMPVAISLVRSRFRRRSNRRAGARDWRGGTPF